MYMFTFYSIYLLIFYHLSGEGSISILEFMIIIIIIISFFPVEASFAHCT